MVFRKRCSGSADRATSLSPFTPLCCSADFSALGHCLTSSFPLLTVSSSLKEAAARFSSSSLNYDLLSRTFSSENARGTCTTPALDACGDIAVLSFHRESPL